MKVAVLDTTKKPLAPTTPRRARLLLKKGKAAVFRRFPFTIVLKREVENPTIPDLRLKIDPGSKTTGVVILNQESGAVVFAAEINHRGSAIKSSLNSRRAIRRGRRNRKTRYRPPRFENRTRPKGWLAPSLKSRVDNVETWTNRLTRFYPISGIALELVRFDTRLMENAEISGIEYQQGELAGYELKEYLLLKWGHECVYKSKGPCDQDLEVEHITPRSGGGTNRVSNLTIACRQVPGEALAALIYFAISEMAQGRSAKAIVDQLVSHLRPSQAHGYLGHPQPCWLIREPIARCWRKLGSVRLKSTP